MMDDSEPRLTLASLKVLQIFLRNPNKRWAGSDLRKFCDVQAGSLYPMLYRFASAGWLTSKWENIDPKKAGRPKKCLYWLTPVGRARARAALTSLEKGRP